MKRYILFLLVAVPFFMSSIENSESPQTAKIPVIEKDAIGIASYDFIIEDYEPLQLQKKMHIHERVYIYQEDVSYTSSCGGGCNGGCVYHVKYMECKLAEIEEKNEHVATLAYRDNPRTYDVPEFYEVKVYPNPFRHNATVAIDGYDDEAYSFDIFDLTGKQVMHQEKMYDSQFQISGDNLSAGIYIYRLVTESQSEVHNGKFIVQ